MTERQMLLELREELVEHVRDAQAALLDALNGTTCDDWRERATVAEINLDSVRRLVEVA